MADEGWEIRCHMEGRTLRGQSQAEEAYSHETAWILKNERFNRRKYLFKGRGETSLVVWWLSLWGSSAGSVSSIPGQGTRDPCAILWMKSAVNEALRRELNKTTGVGWQLCWEHGLCAKSIQSCPTLCDPLDCSSPGFSVHGILQAGILEWVAVSSSRGSSPPRDWTHVFYVSRIGRRALYN